VRVSQERRENLRNYPVHAKKVQIPLEKFLHMPLCSGVARNFSRRGFSNLLYGKI